MVRRNIHGGGAVSWAAEPRFPLKQMAPSNRDPHLSVYIRSRARCRLVILFLAFLFLVFVSILLILASEDSCLGHPCPDAIPSFYLYVLSKMLSNITLGGALGRSLFFMSTRASAVSAASADDYTSHAVDAIETLNAKWYGVSTGIWDQAWWNSANTLTTLADFARLRLDEANDLNIGGYMLNTYIQAQKAVIHTTKAMTTTGMVTSTNCFASNESCVGRRESLDKRGDPGFINEYYDDEGWWALAMIHAYDASGYQDYLGTAVDIFNDMQTGTGTPCGGGIFWNKERLYVNAIANELYLSVAASLANRIPTDGSYLEIAQQQWAWFENSGMINSDNLINDGLTSECQNNGLQTWSYNQGVVLGGLVELYRATQDASLLAKAKTIARAAINKLSNSAGVLVECDGCELQPSHCGSDGQTFKGAFIRNLRYLQVESPEDDFRDFIIKNADVIWANDRQGSSTLGVAWNGPFILATGATQGAALDAIVGAIAVA